VIRIRPSIVLGWSLAVLLALAALVALVGVLPGDVPLREAIVSAATPWLLAAMRVVKRAGHASGLVPGLVLLFALVPASRRRWWLWLAVMLAAAVTPDLLKWLVGRPRPEDPSLGFPSGHATAAAAFFGMVMYLARSLSHRVASALWWSAATMIVLVGVARVMQRDHWPSDALGGIALGLALAAAAAALDSATRP
jgi:undecaprenyl-diphosphatase